MQSQYVLSANCVCFPIDTCKPPKVVQGFAKACNGWYTWDNEDTAHYDLNWLPIKNSSLHNPPTTYRSWEYHDSNELDTYPFLGKYSCVLGCFSFSI